MGSPIRILHVVVNMNRGGAETLIMNIYKNIDRTKVQFDFLTCKQGTFDKEILRLGGRIHRIPYISDVGHFKYIRELRDFFAKNDQYSIVHSHLDKMSGLVLTEAKNFGVPVRIAHSHNTSSEGRTIIKIYKSLVGLLINKNATHFLACTANASEWLFKSKSERANILKNGIDFENFKFSAAAGENVRNELKIPSDSFVLGHVGRFSLQKNHSFIIDTFEMLYKLKPNSYLLLTGDGPLKTKIAEKAESLNLKENVRFLGVRDDIGSILNSFDAMIFPSFHEGFGIALLEAQAIGIPCLISDNIPIEIDMGAGLIHFANLNETPEIWAEKLLSLKKDINYSKEEICKNGYDIHQSSTWIQEYYLRLANLEGA